MTPPAPPSLPIAQALGRSEPLVQLSQRLQQSRQRFEAISPLLTTPLRSQVRPGPLDSESWALLVANGAVAAKLRHMLPALEAELLRQGWPAVSVRVRVLAAE